jgi:Fungal chitosanase of glycosyl hydrolase group 75
MKSLNIYVLLIYAISLTKCHKSNENACGDKLLTTIENFNVFVKPNGTILYRAKFAIDADGSPRAYGPSDSGLDINENAKNNGQWVGVVTDAAGKPLIQKQGDPYPGLYVSQTALYDVMYNNTDPRCYVDAEKIPYIVLPPALIESSKANMGDMAYVYNPATKKGTYAIVADEGPEGLLGEGSIYLASALGIANINPRDGGLVGEAIQYIVFPRSGLGNGRHRSIAEIEQVGKIQMQKIGSEMAILTCF